MPPAGAAVAGAGRAVTAATADAAVMTPRRDGPGNAWSADKVPCSFERTAQQTGVGARGVETFKFVARDGKGEHNKRQDFTQEEIERPR
ncbi:hypothetical protein GCM10010259_57380 [Streptomyces daghestanicus]|uniref:Uncharacterized protein n=2 Tax=Streptomyces TaxID=1883 RepID=A0A918GVL1_STRGD|nr:hypothetical protein GCM10010238_60240 [Streptomyces niveoruber]GGT25116.1 hypothetical protein GCM10010240_66980 [Streptomyces griseoviridis]GGU58930.1 hypothetical protein GCM10010259_57380 [Streptomyces daghestanicus]GHI30083.1 hypothetical protein Sdagh_18130 [Streptomyces daghestanicus]